MRPCVVFLLPFLCVAAAAQTAPVQIKVSNWDNVKMLAPGTQVRVASAASKPVQGTLESVSDSALVLTQGSGPQSFPRPQILSVSVKKGDHRLRNALIGLGAGTAAGAAIGYGVGRAQASNCKQLLCGFSTDIGLFIGGVSGLVGGTLTGVFWPTGGWRKIYVP